MSSWKISFLNKVVSSLSVIKDYENGFIVNSKKEIDYAIEKIDYTIMSNNCIETAKQFSIEKEANVIAEGLKGFLKWELLILQPPKTNKNI